MIFLGSTFTSAKGHTKAEEECVDAGGKWSKKKKGCDMSKMPESEKLSYSSGDTSGPPSVDTE